MTVALDRPGLKVVLGIISCVAMAAPGGSRPATAATIAEQNRAALVVDTGEQVKKVCVRFSEESISGAELLRRAEVDAGLRPYAGKGVAVCSLCGVGCRTDESCLTCDPDGRYWAYSRAPAGTSSFRLSPAGASNTEVRNGDVEGWRWSRGSAPGYSSVEEVCDGAAPPAASTGTTTPTPTATSSPAATVAPASSAGSSVTPAAPSVSSRPGSPASTGTVPRSPSSTTATPVAPAGNSSTSSSSSRSSPPKPAASSAGDQTLAGQRAARSDDGGGSPAGLLAFAGLLGGLLGWAAWARRRRHRL